MTVVFGLIRFNTRLCNKNVKYYNIKKSNAFGVVGLKATHKTKNSL